MRTYPLICLILVLSSFPSFPDRTIFAQEKTPVAVIDFYAPEISQSAVVSLSNIVRRKLIETNSFIVVDRNNMQEILEEHNFQQSGACTDLSCMVQIGQMLGVRKMVGGTIGLLGSKYIIDLQLVDVESGQIEKMENTEYMGPVEGLDASIGRVTIQLTGQQTPEVVELTEDQSERRLFRTNGGYLKYSDEKRSPKSASIRSLLFPGLGHFYNHKSVKGILFFVGTLSGFYLGSELGLAISENDGVIWALALSFTALVKIWDMTSASKDARDYNDSLIEKYRMSLYMNPDAVICRKIMLLQLSL